MPRFSYHHIGCALACLFTTTLLAGCTDEQDVDANSTPSIKETLNRLNALDFYSYAADTNKGYDLVQIDELPDPERDIGKIDIYQQRHWIIEFQAVAFLGVSTLEQQCSNEADIQINDKKWDCGDQDIQRSFSQWYQGVNTGHSDYMACQSRLKKRLNRDTAFSGNAQRVQAHFVNCLRQLPTAINYPGLGS